MSSQTDALSPAGRNILKLHAIDAYTKLVPGSTGNADARPLLEATKATDLVLPPIKDEIQSHALLAGLWLWHDWLDESHRVSQALDSQDGSFWHAIMHRREGDFSNAKYWYNRAGAHPLYPSIMNQVQGILNPLPAEKPLLKITWNGWDPDAFVDLVEAVHEDPNDPKHRAAVAIQQIEWRSLFDHCLREASGR